MFLLLKIQKATVPLWKKLHQKLRDPGIFVFLKVVLTLGVWGFLFFNVKEEFIYFYKILLVTERRVRTTELRLPFHWVMVVHSFNPSSQEARIWVQGQPTLQSKYQDNQGYTEKHLKKKRKEIWMKPFHL